MTMKIAPTFTARSVFSNFGPWIVYGLLAVTGHAPLAYVGDLIASLCQTAPQWRARRLKIMDGVTLVFFLAGAVSTLAFHSSLFPRTGSVLIWGTFALIAWGSLLAGAPFTAEYARDAVPPEYWADPAFRRVNAIITAVWGAVFVINAVLAVVVASKIGASLGRAALWLLVLPYVGTLFGIVFTNRFPQWASQRTPKGGQT